MNRSAQVAIGIGLMLLAAALYLLPMILLGERPGQWLTWSAGGALILGLCFAAPMKMEQFAETARETLPFLGGGGE